MDILLIYPPLSLEKRYGNRRVGNVGGYLPPLGLAYIASFLREKGFSVGIIDGPISNLSEEDILEEINRLRPRVIGFSAMTPVFHKAARMAELIKRRFTDVLIIIGGHHASILPTEVLLENPSFDLLVYGEGEVSAWEILRQYKNCSYKRDNFLSDYNLLEGIKGIAFRRQGNVYISQPREPIEDLDILPYPAWDLLPMHKYVPLPNQYLNRPVVNIVSIRGCPFQCSFCSADAVFGRKIRSLSPSRLLAMIKYVKSRFAAREISFWDDNMTVDKKWMLEFCRLMIEEKAGMTWTCYSRVDTVDKEILSWMKKAGCWNIFYGFESGNQELLDGIGKNVTLQQIRQVNQWTKELGIEVRASFMIALPAETPEMAEKTIDFAISLEPDYAQFSITTPFPKTRLHEQAQRYGRISLDFSRYNGWETVFIPYGYKDARQIETIEKRAVLRFYLRPKYIWGRVRKMRSFKDFIKYLKGFRILIGFAAK